MRHIAILAEGSFNWQDAKTAVGILRYSPDIVVAVIDSANAGREADQVLGDVGGLGSGVPVVSDVSAALRYGPDTVVIGIAPIGGQLPGAWKAQLLAAMDAGLNIISGLHHFLSDDPELVAAADRNGVSIWDVRRPPDDLAMRICQGLAHRPGSRVVHFTGTDCNVGKMTVALECTREAQRRGLAAAFAATGQTGIMIEGSGIPADRFISDFLAGGVEGMVLDLTDRFDWVFVEGQGSLIHPAYSAVTLGLLHGALPDLLVLCHEAGRRNIRHYDVPIPPLSRVRAIYEEAAAWRRSAPTVALALNTQQLSNEEALAAIYEAEKETGLPATDPVRYGASRLIDALMAAVTQSEVPQL